MDEAKCVDCADWFGSCLSAKREKRSRLNRLASSGACSDLNPEEGKLYRINLIQRRVCLETRSRGRCICLCVVD